MNPIFSLIQKPQLSSIDSLQCTIFDTIYNVCMIYGLDWFPFFGKVGRQFPILLWKFALYRRIGYVICVVYLHGDTLLTNKQARILLGVNKIASRPLRSMRQ